MSIAAFFSAAKLRAAGTILSAACLLLPACKEKRPSMVLDKQQMADVLVDVHKAEAVIDQQRGTFRNDSLRAGLREAVYAKHGIDVAVMDSSLSWYGHHVEEYNEVYDVVIERLQAELRDADAAALASPVFAEGDSTDIWPGAKVYRVTTKLPVDNLTFTAEIDANSHPGDNYQLQMRVSNAVNPSEKAWALIMAEYADGKREYRVSPRVTEGWLRLRLVTDSTQTPTAVYGSVTFSPSEGETLYVDSVAFVRTRLNRATYPQRTSQHIIDPIVDKSRPAPSDTIIK